MDRILIQDYWRHAFWQCIFNVLPLSGRTLEDFQVRAFNLDDLKLDDLKKDLKEDRAKTVWIAPWVYTRNNPHSSLDTWIPIWLPARLISGSLQPCSEALPWIPPSQFDGLIHEPLFTGLLHSVDVWLQYDYLDALSGVTQSWEALLRAVEQFLSGLNENWRACLSAWGFSAAPSAMADFKALPAYTQNNLLARYTRFSESWDSFVPQSAPQWESVVLSRLAPGQFITVFSSPANCLRSFCEASSTRERLFSNESIQVFTRDKSWAQGADFYLYPGWYLLTWDHASGAWRASAQLAAGCLFLLEAHCLFSVQVLPLLSQVSRAVIVGDQKALLPRPFLSAVTEERSLPAALLAALEASCEEEGVEELQYRGMLAGGGNAFTVASTSLAPQIYLASPRLPDFYAVNAPGGAGGESQAIRRWCEDLELEEAEDLSEILIVTPYKKQADLLSLELTSLTAAGAAIYCVDQLPARQWDTVIFSPASQMGDPRPFVFDEGEALLASVVARARCALWVIGDLRIFDVRMHSASGNLAKKLTIVPDYIF